ncbi:Imm30 family immunity protein [Polyangium mundeleinium]|uniref:Imm30 family immunity protein n=1 Tax=Polyangium mundeleinium TaxID=2995306 RepID=A0ABT5EJD2_9BACT|nr:Imm30 family immunity protein [Polyangium mundeleinium]MDC0740846.1 Imm30 family immunity protein [Polyangium mundeleinium]
MSEVIRGAIRRLVVHQSLTTEADVQSFDEALSICAEHLGEFTRPEVEAILRIFRDDTQHREVMGGLIHLVEAVPINLYVPSVLAVLSDMEGVAQHWAIGLVGAMTNDADYTEALLNAAALAPPEQQVALERVLGAAAARKFANANSVLQRLRAFDSRM